jgi:dethiobiotin synthetase
MRTKIMVAGIGTDVGKTVVSAILTLLFQGNYWKPIQCGNERDSDSSQLKTWLADTPHVIFPPAYSFKAPLSPHHASRLEHSVIEIETISVPDSDRPLIIEGVGGVMVPLNAQALSLDLFAGWDCHWILVSKHYLGSINHTLLSIEMLKSRGVSILGLIFNGESNPDSEAAIIHHAQLPILGKLQPETALNFQTLTKYGHQWRPQFHSILA